MLALPSGSTTSSHYFIALDRLVFFQHFGTVRYYWDILPNLILTVFLLPAACSPLIEELPILASRL